MHARSPSQSPTGGMGVGEWAQGSASLSLGLPSCPGTFLGCLSECSDTLPPLPELQGGHLGLFLEGARPSCVCGLSWFSHLSSRGVS